MHGQNHIKYVEGIITAVCRVVLKCYQLHCNNDIAKILGWCP